MRLSSFLPLLVAGCAGSVPLEPLPSAPPVSRLANISVDSTNARAPFGKDAGDPEIRAMVRAVDPKRAMASVERLVGFGTRHSLSDTKSETRGIGAAARDLALSFRDIGKDTGGRLQVELMDYTVPKGPRVPKPWPMQNVLALLPGNDPKRVIVLTGHLDSRATDVMNATIDAPGANDDASGVAVVLEACRVMASHHFEVSILFAAVTGEEQGLLGSTALVEKLKKDGLEVEAMLTNDIVGASHAANGRSDKRNVRVFSAGLPADAKERDRYLAVGGEADGPGRQLSRALEEASFRYVDGFGVLPVMRFDRYLRGGDHRPFHEAGVPAARLTEVDEDFRHQHQDVKNEAGVEFGDLPKFVDAQYLANVARVNVAGVATLARAPRAPKHVRLETRGLDEDTTMLYVPLSTPGVSYQVLARPTRLSTWTWTQSVQPDKSGKIRIPLSKDHWIFGLRAIGPKGHTSLAVFPLPLLANDPWPPPE